MSQVGKMGKMHAASLVFDGNHHKRVPERVFLDTDASETHPPLHPQNTQFHARQAITNSSRVLCMHL